MLESFKKEYIAWKDDMVKLWDFVSYFSKEAMLEYNYVITAVNGSIVLEQRVTKSGFRYRRYIKQMQEKWGASNVRYDSVRVF